MRRVAKPLKRVDAELVRQIEQMFDLMYEHKGIGLAATQVDLPYRFFVLNLTGDPGQREWQQVFLNPVVSQPKGGLAEAEEGCLSLPGLYAQVRRPAKVRVQAYDLRGQEIDLAVDGLFARAVQHEADHLDGVLFIDRLTPTALAEVRESLLEFEDVFASQQQTGAIPPETEILARLAELEQLRT